MPTNILDLSITEKDFESWPKYADQKYWFVHLSPTKVSIMRTQADENGTLHIADQNLTADNTLKLHPDVVSTVGEDEAKAIEAAWVEFSNRPEHKMYDPDYLDSDVSDLNVTEMVYLYETMLAGSVFTTAYKEGSDPDTSWKKINRCLEWLRRTDFYTCPASTQYHDSCSSGLLAHSLKVVYRILDLISAKSFVKVDVEDAVFSALVHDWCKIGLYILYTRNVKNDTTGQWEAVEAYKYAENRTICLGHGTSSMYLVMKFFHISIEVAAAIRHHMSVWNCPQPEFNELQQANRQYPLVHLLQFADQLSIVDY